MANVWCVALDDSDDGKREHYLLAGSLFGNKTAWNNFNKAWHACLCAEPRVEYFHQKELTALDGQFHQFKDRRKWPKPTGSEAANLKREALVNVIATSSLSAHALALSVPEYNDIRDKAPNAKLFLDPDPWIYLLQEVAFDTATRIAADDAKAAIAFLSDSSNKSVRYTEFYQGFKKKNPKIAQKMVGITHDEERSSYALQAADLVAAEAKKCYDELFQTSKQPKQIQLLDKFVTVATIPKERIAAVIAHQTINR